MLRISNQPLRLQAACICALAGAASVRGSAQAFCTFTSAEVTPGCVQQALGKENIMLQRALVGHRKSEALLARADVVTPAVLARRAHIQISGRQLLVDGKPIHLKGVDWNPVAKGGGSWDVDFLGFVDQDADLMKEAGINSVRPYLPITDKRVLDKLWQRGIWVLNAPYVSGGASVQSAADVVNAVKDHPSILMWCVGNEWNYNGLYAGLSYEQAVQRVADVSTLVKQIDPSRPVSTIYGELPSTELLSRLSMVDIWGINAYRGLGLGDLFSRWAELSSLPMYLGEYGADAYDATQGRENANAQAEATRVITDEIVQNSAVRGGVCLGGIIFELADEWWKDSSGSFWVHDVGGMAPGGGPYPDMTFNEEWWGLVTIDRVKRDAFEVYKSSELPVWDGSISTPSPTKAPQEPAQCATAVPGEECFGAVDWAMSTGIHTNPEWYPSLTASSSFEEFQAVLHSGGHGNCAKPCPPCHTAQEAEQCYDGVIWAMTVGIHQNPEWYPSLTPSSAFEEFQEVLHESGHENCPKPCPPTKLATTPTHAPAPLCERGAMRRRRRVGKCSCRRRSGRRQLESGWICPSGGSEIEYQPES